MRSMSLEEVIECLKDESSISKAINNSSFGWGIGVGEISFRLSNHSMSERAKRIVGDVIYRELVSRREDLLRSALEKLKIANHPTYVANRKIINDLADSVGRRTGEKEL